MATSEADLKNQLADLDWGTGSAPATVSVSPEPNPTTAAASSAEGASARGASARGAPTPPSEGDGGLDGLDVGVAGVAGVKPAKAPRARKTPAARTVRVVQRQPLAQALLDAATDGQTVAGSSQPDRVPLSRRGRNTQPDVLTAAGESPAVIALFDAMWKDVGAKLARGIGRPKASRQDAAIGWYAMLLAMRERDAR